MLRLVAGAQRVAAGGQRVRTAAMVLVLVLVLGLPGRRLALPGTTTKEASSALPANDTRLAGQARPPAEVVVVTVRWVRACPVVPCLARWSGLAWLQGGAASP